MVGITIGQVRETTRTGVLQAASNWSKTHPSTRINVVAGSRSRSADENTVIAKVQASEHRNPWYLGAQVLSDIRVMLFDMKGGFTSANLNKLGARLLEAVRDNVKRQANANQSPFKTLTAAYAEAKRKRRGSSKPILRDTGELLDTLRVEIQRN